jgi:hypothetical protein
MSKSSGRRTRRVFSANESRFGTTSDYFKTTTGNLKLIPEGPSLAALERDYAAMLEDGLLPFEQSEFSTVLAHCAEIERKINQYASER